MEEVIRERSALYKMLVEQSPDPIVLVRQSDGKMLFYNPPAYEQLGYSRKEFGELKISDLDVNEDEFAVTKHMAAIVENGGDTFITQHKTKDGRILDMQVVSRPITINGDVYFQSVWHNVTERLAKERKLLEQRETTMAFAYALAHDFRAPIRTIKNHLNGCSSGDITFKFTIPKESNG